MSKYDKLVSHINTFHTGTSWLVQVLDSSLDNLLVSPKATCCVSPSIITQYFLRVPHFLSAPAREENYMYFHPFC